MPDNKKKKKLDVEPMVLSELQFHAVHNLPYIQELTIDQPYLALYNTVGRVETWVAMPHTDEYYPLVKSLMFPLALDASSKHRIYFLELPRKEVIIDAFKTCYVEFGMVEAGRVGAYLVNMKTGKKTRIV